MNYQNNFNTLLNDFKKVIDDQISPLSLLKENYTFDDVLLKPKFSSIKSRDTDVNLQVSLPKGFNFKIPIISANMKNVTEPAMANVIGEMGGLALLHRFCTIEEQVKMFNDCLFKDNVGASVGIKPEDKDRAKALVSAGCKILCIDVAHAHSSDTGVMTAFLSKEYPDVLLIVGNVATKEATLYLQECGADVVKCGIGSGSICTTRINAGAGVPQLSALDDCCNLKNHPPIISDGGIKRSGDAVKALCFADMIMLGNMLAGTDEAPGNTIVVDGISYKEYAGSSTYKATHVEGVSGLVKSKGKVKDVLQKIIEGITSGCAYQGATNLKELKNNPTFVKITNSGLVESHPHDIMLLK